jgi:mercuric reductase
LVQLLSLSGELNQEVFLWRLTAELKYSLGGNGMNNVKNYDFIVLGGGAGGFAAAIRADEIGAKVAMINGGLPLGGTCINVGCVPSKRLLWAGEVLHAARNGHLPGLKMRIESVDFGKFIQDELELVSRLREEKYQEVLNGLKSTTFYPGQAKFVSGNAIQVDGQKLQTGKILIATGSAAMVPPIQGLEQTGYVTHVGALAMEQLPEKLTIIGAGPVGVEFAQMYHRFGSKVTVLKRSQGILRFAETDLARRLQNLLESEGIRFITYEEIQKAVLANGKKLLSVVAGGRGFELAGDEIMVAAGKIPNTQDLNLEAAGVKVNQGGAVEVNSFFQTSNPDVYAIGDVADLPARLETTAGREGTLAANNALTGARDRINYDHVPFTVFTDPQLAGVGLTEAQQVQRAGYCNCRTVDFSKIPKAIIMDRTQGLIKMNVEPDSGRIRGVHVLSPHAGEIIAAAMFMVQNQNTLDDVINSLPMFPTLSEALRIVALSFRTDINNLTCCV